MTQRSIRTGKTPQLTIRSSGDLVIKGWDSNSVRAETAARSSVQIKQHAGGFELQMDGGQVMVPFASQVTVYSGKSAELQDIQGPVVAYAGQDLRLRQIGVLAQASAGKTMEIDCTTVAGVAVEFTAGRDLHCRMRTLNNAQVHIDDRNGKRKIVIGAGSIRVWLKAGGAITVVTDQKLI